MFLDDYKRYCEEYKNARRQLNNCIDLIINVLGWS